MVVASASDKAKTKTEVNGKRQVYIRVGHRYLKTIGSHGILGGRSFELPVDTAFNSRGRLYVANRSEGNPRVTILDLDEEYHGEFGSPNVGGEGQVRWPGGIAIDSADAVYIAEQHAQRVNVYAPDGALTRHWGRCGSGAGEFREPSGIAFDADDNLYLADSGNHRIQKYTADGEYVSGWGRRGSGEGEFNMPWGVALDADGDVYVADWGNDRVQKFTADGEFVMAFGGRGRGNGEFHRPSGVAVDRGGDIYVADWGNDRVQVFDPKGVFQVKFGGDATLSKWGLEIILGSPDFARERHRATLEPERRLWRPNSVKVDAEDRIVITDTSRHRLQIYQKESVAVDADWLDLENPKRELQFR